MYRNLCLFHFGKCNTEYSRQLDDIPCRGIPDCLSVFVWNVDVSRAFLNDACRTSFLSEPGNGRKYFALLTQKRTRFAGFGHFTKYCFS